MNRSLLFRLLVTIGLPLLVILAGERILLPEIPEDIVERIPGSRADFGIFALGIEPIIAAYILVEVVAFLVPRWRHLRHGNPAGRTKLETAARVLALVIAVVQSYRLAAILGGGRAPSGSLVALLMMTLVGGVCIQFVVAGIITRWGCLNGIVALMCVGALDALLAAIADASSPAYEPRALALDAAALVVALVATWVMLRGAGQAAEPNGASRAGPGTPYRDRDAQQLVVHPYIPLPSSSYLAHTWTISLLMLPATLASLGLPTERITSALQRGTFVHALATLSLNAVLGVALSWILHRPSEMSDLAARLGSERPQELRREARVAWRRALAPSLLYFVVVVFAENSRPAALVSPGILVLPVLLDFVHAVRSHGLGLVPVWEERRASAVPVIRAALGAHGIAVETAGMHVLAFWQAFVPYAPARLLVRPNDADRARAILGHLFLGAEPPSRHPDAEQAASLHPFEVPCSNARRMAILAACAIVAGVVFAWAGRPSARPETEPRARLEVIPVDDAIDPLGNVNDEEHGQISIFTENVGDDRVHFARAPVHESEGVAASEERLHQWLATVSLPQGAHWGVFTITESDRDTGQETIVGIRSYILVGEPILTEDDIVGAEAVAERNGGSYVSMTLSDDAARRFEDATEKWQGRRLAILLDGTIHSAPVVYGAIRGGHVPVTMGAGEAPKVAFAKAKALARRLQPR
ncbi:hypothetical protein LZC95_08610 [Pendulispora brunnea]|uniref:SecDF P1 head subdomain domain-containing protein n=1 Tax=Pendulispora brunnea TaxID=2905690 RepID=A0ABZ2KE06_9BACT